MDTRDTLHTWDRVRCAQEPARLAGWKLILSWVVLFSLGWGVALALFGAIYWLLG